MGFKKDLKIIGTTAVIGGATAVAPEEMGEAATDAALDESVKQVTK